MPLTTHALVPLLNHLTRFGGGTTPSPFKYVFLASQTSNVIQVGDLLGSHLSERIKGNGVLLDFGGGIDDPYGGFQYSLYTEGPPQITTTGSIASATTRNDLTGSIGMSQNPPLVFLIPEETTITHLIFTNDEETEGVDSDPMNRVVTGIISIPSVDRPYFANDGAYYINSITVNMVGE